MGAGSPGCLPCAVGCLQMGDAGLSTGTVRVYGGGVGVQRAARELVLLLTVSPGGLGLL